MSQFQSYVLHLAILVDSQLYACICGHINQAAFVIIYNTLNYRKKKANTQQYTLGILLVGECNLFNRIQSHTYHTIENIIQGRLHIFHYINYRASANSYDS